MNVIKVGCTPSEEHNVKCSCGAEISFKHTDPDVDIAIPMFGPRVYLTIKCPFCSSYLSSESHVTR